MVTIRVFIEGGVGPFDHVATNARDAVDHLKSVMELGVVRASPPPVGELTYYPPWVIQRIEIRPDAGENVGPFVPHLFS